jgi:hypothetical protein
LDVLVAEEASADALKLGELLDLVQLVLLGQLLLEKLLLREIWIHQQEIITAGHRGLQILLELRILSLIYICVSLLQILQQGLVVSLLQGQELLILQGLLVLILDLLLVLRLMGATETILALGIADGLLLRGSSKGWLALVALGEGRLVSTLIVLHALVVLVELLKSRIGPISADVAQGVLFVQDSSQDSIGTGHHVAHGSLVALDGHNWRSCLLIIVLQVVNAG